MSRQRFAVVAVLMLVSGCAFGAGLRRSKEERGAAMEACSAGLASGATLNTGEWTNQFARSCADLFAEPVCQQAWAQVPEREPASKMTSVIEPCRSAYCPTLPSPRPALCNIEGVVPPAQHDLWPPFARAVLARDLGMNETEVDAFFASLPRPAPSRAELPTGEDDDSNDPYLEVVRSGAQVKVSTGDAFALFDAGESEALKAWVRAHTSASGTLVLVFDPELDFAVVRTVMEVEQERGVRVRVTTTKPPR